MEIPDKPLLALIILILGICIGIALVDARESINSQLEHSRVFLAGTSNPDLSNDIIIGKLIECESGGNPWAIGKAGEIGLLQYMPATWKAFNEKRGTELNIYKPDDQIKMTKWALENNLHFHWTCWYKI